MLNRQICRLFTLQDASDIDARLLIRLDEARTITHETTRLDKLSISECCRDGVTSRQCDEPLTLTVQKAIICDKQGGFSALNDLIKSGPEVRFPARIHYLNFNANSLCPASVKYCN